MPLLLRTTYPRKISSGTFALTLNMRPEELEFLALAKYGFCYFTRDGNPPGGTQESMDRLYKLLKHRPPRQFTSLALRTSESASRDAQTLIAYGPITLEIDFQSVANDLVVFNGDAQDLAYDLTSVVPLDHNMESTKFTELLCILTANKRTRTNPRQVGSYYEARLMRALVPRDISAIYIAGNAGLTVACALCEQ